MRKKLLFASILAMMISTIGIANPIKEDSLNTTLFKWVKEQNLTSFKIEVDIVKLQALKKTNEYLPAKVYYQLAEGDWQEWELEIRSRGKYRRLKCDFPPLKLNFSKKELKKVGFKPYDDFKLVTHCLEEGGKEIVLREYLTYKLYQILTDYSFKVHLAEILYQDTNSQDTSTHYGILIEPEKELRKRINAKNCKDCFNLPPDRFQKNLEQINALFQYMICNTDYSITRLRNVALVESKENEKIIPIPYDFDFSGLVNAPYAIPQPEYNLISLRTPLYLGFAKDNAELQETIAFFNSKKAALFAEVNNFDYLSKKSRKDITKLIKKFYKRLDKNRVIK